MKDNILKMRKYFKEQTFEVVFHHSLDKDKFLSTHNASEKHVRRHNEFADWLKQQNIVYRDISGNAERLMEYYAGVDLHIGYRVHAHIFMNSIAKFSILISEDGRAKATKNVIGGIVLDGYTHFHSDIVSKILNRFLFRYDRYKPNKFLTQEVLHSVKYEKKIDFIRCKNSRINIDNNLEIMKKFIKQLP